MYSRTHLYLFSAVIAVFAAQGAAPKEAPIRELRVALYPYVPERADLFLKVEQQFEANHKDVRMVFIDVSGDYYGEDVLKALQSPEEKFRADVVEVDTVLLKDLVDGKLIEPIPAANLPSRDAFLPVAAMAADIDGKTYGVPHWVCGNFIFFRRDDPDASRLAAATTLKGLEEIFHNPTTEQECLLVDVKGKTTIGELYLDSLFDEYGGTAGVDHIGDADHLDSQAAEAVKRLCRFCPDSFNHNAKYHDNEHFYGRQFAHGRARAILGYSEALYDVGEEFLHGVADGEPSPGDLSKDQIDAIPAPLSDAGEKMLAWVDVLTIRAGLSQQTRRDALDFVSEYTSAEFNKKILTAGKAEAPRYLLPARVALYGDEDILKAAPLYGRFKVVMQDATTARVQNLNKRLRDIGKKLDGQVCQSP